METISQYYTRLSKESKINKKAYKHLAELTKNSKTFILTNYEPEVLPITKPAPVITPAPSQDDPFNVPAPKINPTPKGFL
jgi:hypothetical protein